jgi:hypothetical protein
MRNNIRTITLLSLFSLWTCLDPAWTMAEVVRVQIDRRGPFADGHHFGQTGSYESLAGRLFFEVDPDAPANACITDLKRAPRNKRGRVEFWADFYLLKPVDPGKGNRRLLYDVHNRGNKLALWTFNDAERTNEPATMEHAGNGFLLREGYTLLWTGWNGDVIGDGTGRLLAGLPVAVQEDGTPITGKTYVETSVDEKTYSRPFFGSPWGTPAAYPTVSLDDQTATLTIRPTRSEPAIAVPRDAWAFARWEDGKVISDPTSLYVKEGLRPGWLYDLVYTARDPRVSGLGLAGLRDAVSFFRYADQDDSGMADSVRGAVDRAYIFGISQSGRLIHHFLYEGLNFDVSQRCTRESGVRASVAISVDGTLHVWYQSRHGSTFAARRHGRVASDWSARGRGALDGLLASAHKILMTRPLPSTHSRSRGNTLRQIPRRRVGLMNSRNARRNVRVTLGGCPPRVPTDPYVHTLEHTVPQVEDSLRNVRSRIRRQSHSRGFAYSAIRRCFGDTGFKVQCPRRSAQQRFFNPTSPFPPRGPVGPRSPASTVISRC